MEFRNYKPSFVSTIHERQHCDGVIGYSQNKSNSRYNDTKDHADPEQEEHILIQNILAHLAYKFMLVGDQEFDVL